MEFWKLEHFVCLLTLFSISSRQVYSQCDGTHLSLTATSGSYDIGEITYPASGLYGELLDCAWLIESSSSNKLLLYISITSIAANDFIRVYDGKSTSGTILFTTTGSSHQSSTNVASGGNVYIRFTSDGNPGTNQKGFHLRYMSASTYDFGCTAVSLNATDTVQFLTSQNFPAKYPSDTSCSWTITALDDCGMITANFIYIDVEGCNYDFLTMTYDGNPPVLLCPQDDWNSASIYTTINTTLTITMTSDDSDEKNGFVMAFWRTGCTSQIPLPVETEPDRQLLSLLTLIAIPITVFIGLWKAGICRCSKVGSASTSSQAVKAEEASAGTTADLDKVTNVVKEDCKP